MQGGYNDTTPGFNICYQIGSGSNVINAASSTNTSCLSIYTITNIPSGSSVKVWVTAINSGGGAVPTGTAIKYDLNVSTSCPPSSGGAYCLTDTVYSQTVTSSGSVALTPSKSSAEFVTC